MTDLFRSRCCGDACQGPCVEHGEVRIKPGNSIRLWQRALAASNNPPVPGCPPQQNPVQAAIQPEVRLPDGSITVVSSVTYAGNGWHRADFGPVPLTCPEGRAFVRWQQSGSLPSQNALAEYSFWVESLDF